MVGAMPVNIIPKFCNGTMESHDFGEDGAFQVRIGSRIKCSENFGTVRYIGEVRGYQGVWYGVEWDEPSRGKHDGSIDDIQYFKTTKPGAGSFVRPNKIAPFQSLADAIKKYYGTPEEETVAAHRRTLIKELKREMGAPFIEMVGFEKIKQKQQFSRLTEVSVHDQCVSTAGEVSRLCPQLRSLDVSNNLFSSWREVIHIGAQLPNLTELNLSKNRIEIDLPEEYFVQQSIHFKKLEKINLSYGEYQWRDIMTLSHLWPNVTQIIAAFNKIRQISPPKNTLNLTTLTLDGNLLEGWSSVLNLGHMSSLKVLSVNDCELEDIRFGEDEDKTELFENLEVLMVNRNRINDWRSVSELNKLRSLRRLYFLKNPILATESYDTASQIIIAKIGTLQELNGSIISVQSRRGAEYDYMKRFGAEWKSAAGDDHQRRQFCLQHNRFYHLVDKYGIPDDSLLNQGPTNKTLTSQLLEVSLIDTNGKVYKKKFPATMSVQKLVTLAQRLFAKHGRIGDLNLFCVDDQLEAEIPIDNVMRELNYYSIKNGDTILVKYS